jgi:hypothetical protein
MATLSLPSPESQHFFETLSRRHQAVLVIDFDSTIARLGRADNIFPYPTVMELLDRIASTTGTRLIIASSRPAEQLRSYFGSPGPEIRTFAEVAAMDALGGTNPWAYLAGEIDDAKLSPAGRLRVCPQYRVGTGENAGGPVEDLVQFLVEWLRACTGEVC